MMGQTVFRKLYPVVLAVLGFALFGCGSGGNGNRVTDPAFIGTWQGTEVGGGSMVWTFIITQTSVSVRAGTQEVYSGTYSVNLSTTPKQANFRVTNSSFTHYVGKTALSIYDVQGNNATLASNEPGVSTRPTSFTPGGGARVWHLTKQ